MSSVSWRRTLHRLHTLSTARPQVFHRPSERAIPCQRDVPRAAAVVLDRECVQGRRWLIVSHPPFLPSTPARHTARVVLVAWMTLLVASGAAGGQAPAVPLDATPAVASPWFRLFLVDGQVSATPSDFARADDVVLLAVPLDASAPSPGTHTVAIPSSQVDWPKTEAYRESVRRAQFEAAGGARAFAAFSEEVAATLREVAQITDPLERVRRLESARARLAQWPSLHHGYRAREVSETLSVVDDLLNGLRAAAGQQAFSLALTASTEPPPVEATVVLPPPTSQDVVAQALALAPRVTDAVQRLQLLEASARVLEQPGAALDPRWVREARGQLRRQISQEHRVTRAYARLRTWMLDKTTKLLALADVRGLMRLREDVQQRDARLGHRRPDEVQALLGTVDARLDDARRQRLRLERWAERRPVLEGYAGVVGRHVAASDALWRALEDVKALAGPGPALLTQAEGRLAGARADAGLLHVPDEARAIHQTWASAQQLATRALQTRRAAMRSGDMQQAWEASAAAAGALLLLQQLRGELAALVQPPVAAKAGS